MPHSGAKVMVAEDYDDTRFLLKLMLEMRGCEVVEATNGQEAVDIATRDAFQLILMDLNMPLMDGFEATREIKSNPLTKDVPILAVSAHCRSTDWVTKAYDVGCSECLCKPLDDDIVDHILERYGLCN